MSTAKVKLRPWYLVISEAMFDFDTPETRGERARFYLFKVFVLSFTVHWAWQWGLELQNVPGPLVPLGIARNIDISFMFQPGLALLLAGVITALALLSLAGRYERTALPLLVILMHLQYVARYSLGKAAHGSHYVGFALLMLAVAVWAMPSGSSRHRFAVHATVFCMGLGYVFAGVCKVSNTGLGWVNGEHLWLWIGERSIDQFSSRGTFSLSPMQEMCLSHHGLATGFLTVGLGTELLGFLLWFRSTRTLATLALIGLHAGIAGTLGIVFDAYMYQLAIVGLPIPAVLDWLWARRHTQGSPPRAT